MRDRDRSAVREVQPHDPAVASVRTRQEIDTPPIGGEHGVRFATARPGQPAQAGAIRADRPQMRIEAIAAWNGVLDLEDQPAPARRHDEVVEPSQRDLIADRVGPLRPTRGRPFAGASRCHPTSLMNAGRLPAPMAEASRTLGVPFYALLDCAHRLTLPSTANRSISSSWAGS